MSRTRESGVSDLVEDEQDLRSAIEEGLGEGRVLALERQPLTGPSSFACERIRVRTEQREHDLFLKDYGRCRLPRPDPRAAAEREIWVYRELLSGADLGTPRLVASAEPGDGGGWLLLEYVEGRRLDELGLEARLRAVRWVARLQAMDTARIAGGCPLVQHDARHFLATAQSAIGAVAGFGQDLEERMRNLLEGYEVVVYELDREPRRLVHGSFIPQNLLLAPTATGEGQRLVTVDWEHAALGSVLLDPGVLASGLEREAATEVLREHRRATEELGVPVPPPDRALRLLGILRLHKVLRSLGRAQLWGYDRETVDQLIDQAESRARAISAGVPAGVSVLVPEGEDHPALEACRRCGLDEFRPRRVELVRGRYFTREGRVVYRLGGEGPGESTLIAKYLRLEAGIFEHRVYSSLLPHLQVLTPRARGWLPLDGRGWLFLEDAGRSPLDLSVPSHVAAARALLEDFHASGAAHGRPDWLPDRGTDAHRRTLHEARSKVLAAVRAAAFTQPVRAGFLRLVEVLDRTDRGWEWVERHCSPATVVHGDFRRKNIFVSPTNEGLLLRVIDWEYSGWGPPELDRGALEARVLVGPDRSPPVLAGMVLRYLDAIGWAALGLDFARTEWAEVNLEVYRDRLSGVLDALGVPS